MSVSPSASLMNRATDPIWLFATPTDVRARLLAARLGLSTIERNVRHAIYGTRGREVDLRLAQRALGAAGYVKYFENAYLSEALSGTARLMLIQSYFDKVSSNYSGLTQLDVNISCYEHLFDVARSVRSSFASCLDFGCGPGTILSSSIAASVHELFGWDFSKRMRGISRSRGLAILEEDEFVLGSRKFELIVSAYVLHYGTVSIALLQRLSEHLEIDGVFVANFHKDLGLSAFMSTLAQVENLALVVPVSSTPFGCVLALSRIA